MMQSSSATDVRPVVGGADFATFGVLLAEYEDELPVELRHDIGSELPNLAALYGGSNAAFLAFAGIAPAGCVAVVRLDGSTAVMKRLYVRPSFRQRGIAGALVGAGIRWSRDHAFERVALDTDKRLLSPAYALYKALGFTECEPYGPVDYASPTYLHLRL